MPTTVVEYGVGEVNSRVRIDMADKVRVMADGLVNQARELASPLESSPSISTIHSSKLSEDLTNYQTRSG